MTVPLPPIGSRVEITIPPWIHAKVRVIIGRVTFHSQTRFLIHTSEHEFHPAFIDIRPAPSRRAQTAAERLMADRADLDTAEWTFTPRPASTHENRRTS